MHNRKKSTIPSGENELKAIKEKCTMYKSLVDILIQRKNSFDYTFDSLALTGKMLKLNPDFYSLWNYRRNILQSLHPQLSQINGSSQKLDNEEIKQLELAVTADGIRKNPKSYCAWHHRLWIVDHFQIDFEQELLLCKEFLQQDQRNFHCWNYRRSVFERSGLPFEMELAYSTEKIQENFSNYSAFHHRSIFIKQCRGDMEDILNEEFSIVENAIYTEPDDQSAWWYHQFLIQFAADTLSTNKILETLENQLRLLQELLELEPDSKWCMTGIVYILQHLLSNQSIHSVLEVEKAIAYKDKKQHLLVKLMEIDPNHRARYRYLLGNN